MLDNGSPTEVVADLGSPSEGETMKSMDALDDGE